MTYLVLSEALNLNSVNTAMKCSAGVGMHVDITASVFYSSASRMILVLLCLIIRW